jgi:hypothetical protein
VRTSVLFALWRSDYLRLVRSTFATTPFYREHWALHGRTDPVVVPGKEGTGGGAVPTGSVLRRMADLVPLSGGRSDVDPWRGLGSVLASCVALPAGTLVALFDGSGSRPPADLPRGVRGCVLDPDTLPADDSLAAFSELTGFLRRGGPVLATGIQKDLTQVTAALPDGLGDRLCRIPRRELDQLDSGPFGILADDTLGVLAGLRECGRWHVDWPRVYARNTPAGLAFSLLRQRSPRLVDVLPAGGVPGEVAPCPRHRTPVLLT